MSIRQKTLAVAAASFAANLPLGVWREQQERFSVQWFIAGREETFS